MKDKRQKIDEEIVAARNEIRTDKLDISFGEIANLYENKELIITPEYQRLFRWHPTQKSRFIESILLGIPTPAIFVAEDESGVWELVDGLQRVSTVLEFMGLLKNADGGQVVPSQLVRAGRKSQLPSLEGALFDDLSLKARLSIKRAGCRVEVIKTGSIQKMKYEVFERLNTGGSELTEQEVRNCIFRAMNPYFVDWVNKLSQFKPFSDSLCLSEYQNNTMFDRGLILRYLAIKNAYAEFEHDVEPFVTDYIRDILEENRTFSKEFEETLFKQTFECISSAIGEDAWRHYKDGKHKGAFSVYIFETLSVGLAANIDYIRDLTIDVLSEKILRFKQEPQFLDNTGPGANVKSKLRGRVDFAKSFFSK
ncbi:MAG: hypothetical protein A4E74_01871 [Syntrophus sp. PtaB.Bin075]|nr:MAG: hypothetical protein A4E74_01871 [Syntrophus sp. PtaB.Bin075]